MKKITLLIITIFAFSFGFAQDGGSSCAAAEVLPTTTGTTNYNVTIDIAALGFAPNSVIDGSNAFASFFQFTAPSDGTISLSSCGTGANTRLHLFQGSCGAPSSVVTDNNSCSSGEEAEITNFIVTSGTTYFIEWNNGDTSNIFGNLSFSWDFTFNAVSCFPPSNISIDFKTETRVDFRFDPPTDGTAPLSYDWEIVPLGNAQGVGVVASGTSTDNTPSTVDVGATLVGNTDYDIRVLSNCGGGDFSDWTSPFTFKTKESAPPANDTCFTAEAVSIESNIASAAAATTFNSTILGACFTTANAVNQECFGGENENDDVWYSFTAENGVTFNITAETNSGSSPSFDHTITLFSGSCESLGAKLDCADDTTGNGVEQLTHTNNTGSTQTYYFRVYSFNEATPGDPTFTYKLWSSQTLSNTTFTSDNQFKFYPNPVNDVLNIKAQNTIDTITVYNMLGQQVKTLKPNAVSEEVNMQDLKAGTYFVKVTSNGATKTTKVLKR